jgi:lipopolysaccharide biosynthesis regulator YciM
MDTFLIIILLAILPLVIIYVFYDRYRRDKKGRDPQSYIDGLKAMLEGYDERAFSKFREVISEDSTNIDAYIRIGNILRKYDKADKALQVHKDLTLRPDLQPDVKIAVLNAIAEDYIKLENYDSAADALKEIMTLDGGNRKAAEKLLNVYACLDKWEDAYAIRERIIKMDGGDSRADLAIYKFFQGEKLFIEKKFHKARVIFKEAINLNPVCVPAYIRLGDAYQSENRLEDAVESWRKMISIVPDEAHLVLDRLKKSLFEIGRYGEISDICRDILNSSSSNLDARLTLADYHLKKGEHQLAEEHLKTASENHPKTFLPAVELGRLYLGSDKKDKLGKLFDQLESQRENIETGYRCQKCGFETGDKIWLCPSCKAVDSFVK